MISIQIATVASRNLEGMTHMGLLRESSAKLASIAGDIVGRVVRSNKTGGPDGYLPAAFKDLLRELVKAHIAYSCEIEDRPDEILKEATRPQQDLLLAKLSRYSSNIFAVTYAYPETALQSGLDHDMKQLTFTTFMLCESLGIDFNDLVTQLSTAK